MEGRMTHDRPRCKITKWFLDMYDVQEMIATIGCKHDTRSRPAPSPYKGCHWYKDDRCTKEEWLDEWERRAGAKQITLGGVTTTSQLPKIIPPLPEGDTKDLKTWREYWTKHDAAITAQAREDVLNQIEVVINEEMKPLTRHSVMNNREIAFRWVLKRIEHLRRTGGERQ
jgi:hypothetical protein